MSQNSGPVPASFRDPSGSLFFEEGRLYRRVNPVYRDEYDRLLASGLYAALVKDGLLVPHEEVSLSSPAARGAYKVIAPERVPFISYPYEWSFSQLRDAALATMRIQKAALERGLALKDASTYNVQFLRGRPVLIDSLSFEAYVEGRPWVAYRQFCQHFLAPLALMSRREVRLSQLLRVHIDGIPLDLAASLLPRSTMMSFSLLTHIHLHARSQRRYADRQVKPGGRKLGRLGYLGIMDSLESAVRGLSWSPGGTEWGGYYEETNYSPGALEEKKRLVAEFMDQARPGSVWDLGGNVGLFSRIASDRGIPTVSWDVDPAAVEKNYLAVKERREENLLPLVLDLTNPSPGLGWANEERMSFLERGPVDACLALALIHHLAISNNLPLGMVAGFLERLCRRLIIEFVPKDDSQVRRLLATREDIFPGYTREGFEEAFGKHFSLLRREKVGDSLRTLYLMEKRDPSA